MTEERHDEAYFTEDEVEHSGELTDTELDEGQSSCPRPWKGLWTKSYAKARRTTRQLRRRKGSAGCHRSIRPWSRTKRDHEGVRVAAGFGLARIDEPFDEDHEDELFERRWR